MPRLKVFNQVSIDGAFVDDHGDMRWAHPEADDEWLAFVAGNVGGDSVLVFGRVTYELMAGYWATPAAAAAEPAVAARMNSASKLVFSRTMRASPWTNTEVVNADPVAELRGRKAQPGPDLVILGSGSLIGPLTRERLIDEYEIVVVPIVLGEGRSMFADLDVRSNLRLQRVRPFANGAVVIWYEPA